MSIAEQLLRVLGAPYQLKGYGITSTASIGITTSAAVYQNADDMLRDADTAMYHAKAAGKARYVLFDREMHRQVTERIEMETDLRHAVERDELRLHYQPVVSLADGKIAGFEALVLAAPETRGLLPPAKFIPIAEETGLIFSLGYWVLGEACRQFKAVAGGPSRGCPDLSISVNLSTKQLCISELVPRIRQLLSDTGLQPQCLILEITESAMILNAEVSIPVCHQLKEMGIRLYMDDFGTGLFVAKLPPSDSADGAEDRSEFRENGQR